MLRPTERKKVQWSPHHSNKFVVGGNDLRLYEIRSSVRHGLRNLLFFQFVALWPCLTNSFVFCCVIAGNITYTQWRTYETLFRPPSSRYDSVGRHPFISPFHRPHHSSNEIFWLSSGILEIKPLEKKVITLVGAHTEIQSLKVRKLRLPHFLLLRSAH